MKSETKICRKCKEDKSLDKFFFIKSKNGYYYKCKLCCKISDKEYRHKNKEKISNYYKKRRIANQEKERKYQLDWYYANREKINEARAKKNNPLKNTLSQQEYFFSCKPDNVDTKLHRDKIVQHIRRVVICMIKNIHDEHPTLRRIGTTTPEFKKWIESKFTDGMSWENYGNKKHCWSIDHIWPITRWNLSSRAHRRMCNHFTNLRPMWHVDNIKKGNKLYYSLVA